MGSWMKKCILLSCLLICYVSVTLGPRSDNFADCERNIKQSYNNGGPYDFFLQSFEHYNADRLIRKLTNMTTVDWDTASYFLALFFTIKHLLPPIQSPKRFCEGNYDIEMKTFCTDSIARFRINGIITKNIHAEVQDFVVIRHMYLEVVRAKIKEEYEHPNDDHKVLEIMYAYYDYVYTVAKTIDPNIFLSISTYCANPEKYIF